MRRREFIKLIGGAAAGWPRAALAQQTATPVIGYLQSGIAHLSERQVAAFRKGLSDAGYVEGRNVRIEYRFAEGRQERLPAMAAELVRHRVALIVAVGGAHPALAAKAASTTIPIVFASGDTDPIQAGLVVSFSRPGGNLTGVSGLFGNLAAKRIGLLHELIPTASAIGMLANPNTVSVATQIAEAQKAAQIKGLNLEVFHASVDRDFELAFGAMAKRRIDGLLVSADAFYGSHRQQIIALAERHAIPASHYRREFVEEGGLMSYATPLPEVYRQVGLYAGRILGGAQTTDLPVVQPTRFELVINRKTAKSLGLEISSNLLAITDEVIE